MGSLKNICWVNKKQHAAIDMCGAIQNMQIFKTQRTLVYTIEGFTHMDTGTGSGINGSGEWGTSQQGGNEESNYACNGFYIFFKSS